ncbi:HAD family hydrolase [Gracilibacillus phocaeensis]|uniref:HAD family hydrolase n=1 Tax=Gracilibacillus phocaeensis TaxID=2042304 RepID=UPI00103046B7|nr:HAD family hydrolase [Gracilibacillus phocaeensis]
MLKTVIFDLDGTLLNRDASVQQFIGNQYDRWKDVLGFIPKEHYISRFIELDARGYVWKDKVYQQMVKEFHISEPSWERLLQDYIAEFHHRCIPFPHLIHTLESLKAHKIRLGMITNGKGSFQMNNIRALGIEHFFDTILVSEWEGMKKPDPDIFKKTLSQLQVSAEESMYVGDHPENDVQAARDIGMFGVWKKDAQWSQVEADFIIEDLQELPFIIQAIN